MGRLYFTHNSGWHPKHIVDEYEKADVQGGLGAIVIDDQMIDAALLRVEWRKLAIARKAGLA